MNNNINKFYQSVYGEEGNNNDANSSSKTNNIKKKKKKIQKIVQAEERGNEGKEPSLSSTAFSPTNTTAIIRKKQKQPRQSPPKSPRTELDNNSFEVIVYRLGIDDNGSNNGKELVSTASISSSTIVSKLNNNTSLCNNYNNDTSSGSRSSNVRIVNPLSLIVYGIGFVLLSIIASVINVKTSYNSNASIDDVTLLVGGVTSSDANFRFQIPQQKQEEMINYHFIISTNELNNNNHVNEYYNIVYNNDESSKIVSPIIYQRAINQHASSAANDNDINNNKDSDNNNNNNGIFNYIQRFGVHTLQISKFLNADTKYYYGVIAVSTTISNSARNKEVHADIKKQATFYTPKPDGMAHNFTIVTAGCAYTGSKASIFDTMSYEGNHDILTTSIVRSINNNNNTANTEIIVNTSSYVSPLQFFLHLGDFHYEDIDTSNDISKRLDAINMVLNSKSQSKLYETTALVYTFDDHDWLGDDSGFDSGNDHDIEYNDDKKNDYYESTSSRRSNSSNARNEALLSYDIAFPHYPLSSSLTSFHDASSSKSASTDTNIISSNSSGGVSSRREEEIKDTNTSTIPTNNSNALPSYHAFTVGTIRFIISDLRSEALSRDSSESANNTNIIYSIKQKKWLYNELKNAKNYDFVIWATTKPWIGIANLNKDSWFGYPNDRIELSNYIMDTIGGTNGSQNLLALAADAHMVAFDDGSNTFYGTKYYNNHSNSTPPPPPPSFPILQSGPLDRFGSIKGGPYTEGCYTTLSERNHQYSKIEFEIPTKGQRQQGQKPCIIITSYRVNAYGKKTVIFTKKLCGKIFASSSQRQQQQNTFKSKNKQDIKQQQLVSSSCTVSRKNMYSIYSYTFIRGAIVFSILSVLQIIYSIFTINNNKRKGWGKTGNCSILNCNNSSSDNSTKTHNNNKITKTFFTRKIMGGGSGSGSVAAPMKSTSCAMIQTQLARRSQHRIVSSEEGRTNNTIINDNNHQKEAKEIIILLCNIIIIVVFFLSNWAIQEVVPQMLNTYQLQTRLIYFLLFLQSVTIFADITGLLNLSFVFD